jgi:lysine-N-methylase
MSAAIPRRPRLAAHVVARRHRIDEDDRIVLHDLSSGRLVQIGPREWGLLSGADGTRDIEGIVLAAAREGAHARADALAAFLEQLHAAGLLDDGLEEPSTAVAKDDEPDERAVERPLEPLPGFALTCDGSGSCCRLYASIVFGPVEAARARVLMPEVLGGGERHERVFTPEHGSGPTGGSAVALCEGRCAYLAASGRCGLHEAGGPAAKPVGCTTFPAVFTDDGETVRVSVAVECACVLASVARGDGSPLVPDGARTRSDLHDSLSVSTLPPHIQISADHIASRREFVAWSRRLAAALPSIGAPEPRLDLPAALFALGRAVATSGLDAEPALAPHPAPIDDAAILPWALALHRRASRRANEDATWRAPTDLARRATAWIERAAAAILERRAGGLLEGTRFAREELFYVHAIVHGHQLARPLPVSVAMHDRAVRLLVARALGRVFEDLPRAALDPACAHPLALVEAVLRGHGLDAYAHEV